MTTRFHGRIPCPEPDDPCAVCVRAIDAAEAERYAPTDYELGSSEQEASRYEREVLGL